MIGESYELLFQIRSAGESALAKIREEIRGLGSDAKSAMASVDQIAAGGSGLGRVLDGAKGALASIDSALGLTNASMFQVVATAGLIAAAITLAVDTVGEFYNSWNPVLAAQQESLKTIRDTNREFERQIGLSNRLRLDALERRAGRGARLDSEAFSFEGDAAQARARVAQLERDIAEQKRIANTGGSFDGPAAQEKIRGLRSELELEQLKERNSLTLAQDARDRKAEDEQKDAAARAKKAREEIAAAERAAFNQLQQAQLAELSGVDKIIAKRDQLLALYGKTAKAIADITRASEIEIGTAAAVSN